MVARTGDFTENILIIITPFQSEITSTIQRPGFSYQVIWFKKMLVGCLGFIAYQSL